MTRSRPTDSSSFSNTVRSYCLRTEFFPRTLRKHTSSIRKGQVALHGGQKWAHTIFTDHTEAYKLHTIGFGSRTCYANTNLASIGVPAVSSRASKSWDEKTRSYAQARADAFKKKYLVIFADTIDTSSSRNYRTCARWRPVGCCASSDEHTATTTQGLQNCSASATTLISRLKFYGKIEVCG